MGTVDSPINQQVRRFPEVSEPELDDADPRELSDRLLGGFVRIVMSGFGLL